MNPRVEKSRSEYSHQDDDHEQAHGFRGAAPLAAWSFLRLRGQKLNALLIAAVPDRTLPAIEEHRERRLAATKGGQRTFVRHLERPTPSDGHHTISTP
jgi:hypothetical protein